MESPKPAVSPQAAPALPPQAGALHGAAVKAPAAQAGTDSDVLSGLEELKLSALSASPLSAAEVKQLAAEAAQDNSELKKISSVEASATAIAELLKGGTLKPELRERFERCLIVQSYLNSLRESFNALKEKAHKPVGSSAEQQLATISNLAMDIAGKHSALTRQPAAVKNAGSIDAETASMQQLEALDHLNWADGRLPGEAQAVPQMQQMPPQNGAHLMQQMVAETQMPPQKQTAAQMPVQGTASPQPAFDAVPQEPAQAPVKAPVNTPAPAEPGVEQQAQPKLEGSSLDNYQERIRRQALQLASEDSAASQPAQGLSAAEAASFESAFEETTAPAEQAVPQPLPEINASMSLDEIRRINAAVDAMVQSEADTNVSPLASNFAKAAPAAPAALQAEPEADQALGQQILAAAPSPLAGNFAPSSASQPQQSQPAQMQAPAQPQMPQQPSPAGNFAPNVPQAQPQPVQPAVQAQAPAAVPKRAWQGRPSLSGNFKPQSQVNQMQQMPPAVQMPDYMQDVPLPEDDMPGMPDQGSEPDFDEAEFEAYAENAAQDMLLSQKPAQEVPPLPEVVPVPDTQPQESRAFAGGAPARQRDRTHGLRPVQELPTGQGLPRFKGLKALSADDFYPSLEQGDHYYQLILKTGIKNGPDLNVLLYSELVHEPDAEGVMEICCSEDHHTYVEGTGAAERLEQAFSQVYGRPVKLKLNYMQGIPSGAPSSNAAKALMEETAKKRRELKRNARLMELCNMLGENLNELPLTIYTPDVPAVENKKGVQKPGLPQ